MRRFSPDTVVRPASRYSHGVAHAANARRLVISGQAGVNRDGTLRPDLRGQVEQAFANLLLVAAADGMGPEHIVKINVYATTPEVLPVYRGIRDRLFGDHPPAATYLQVPALASPDWLVEIDGEAVLES